MGFLSDVGKSIGGAVKSVTEPLTDIFSPIGDAFDPISSIVGAGMDAYGAYQQQATSKEMAREQMAFQKQQASDAYHRNLASAREVMSFQERMSNTSHSRAVKDMQSAGLNPILGISKGASSPGGSSAQSPAMPGAKGQAQNIAGAAAQTAIQVSKNRAEINVLEITVDKLVEEIDNISIDSWKKTAERALTSLAYNEKLIVMEMLQEDLKIKHRAGEIAASDYGVALEWIKNFREAIIGGSTPIRPR